MSRYILLLAVFLGLSACNGTGERLREHTYPPSFEYIDQTRLKSAMWVLAREMTLLEDALRHPDGDAGRQQRVVEQTLMRVEEAVASIAKPGRTTQHPLLNENLPHFREQVRRASADVARTPPSYFSASALAGACGGCHDSASARNRPPA